MFIRRKSEFREERPMRKQYKEVFFLGLKRKLWLERISYSVAGTKERKKYSADFAKESAVEFAKRGIKLNEIASKEFAKILISWRIPFKTTSLSWDFRSRTSALESENTLRHLTGVETKVAYGWITSSLLLFFRPLEIEVRPRQYLIYASAFTLLDLCSCLYLGCTRIDMMLH